MIRNTVAILLCMVGLYSASAQKNEYHVSKTFHIVSNGGWDYISVNDGKVYVSHGTQVNILDEKTGDSLGYIPNTTGVHGIAFDNKLGKGYTSNGRLNTVTVFDLKTNEIVTQITTGTNPDAIFYEPFTKTIITCNGRSNDLSVIDPVTGTVTQTIAVGGKPETAVSDGEGKLFVNIEDKNEIAEINLNTFTIENHWPLTPAEGPTGLAIDTKTKRLFAGCNKLLAIMDATNGKIISSQPIDDGCDGVAFDSKNKIVFTSNGQGTITAIKEKSANEFAVQETITTKPSARTITIDEKTHNLFLPAGDMEAADPANPRARRKMIPGTFQILVVSKD